MKKLTRVEKKEIENERDILGYWNVVGKQAAILGVIGATMLLIGGMMYFFQEPEYGDEWCQELTNNETSDYKGTKITMEKEHLQISCRSKDTGEEKTITIRMSTDKRRIEAIIEEEE